MIAHDSRGTPENTRALSAATTQALRAAIEGRWRAVAAGDVEQATEALQGALVQAAAEARERSLHPEDLVLAIKALEADVASRRGTAGHHERQALRARLVTACIRAYFGAV
jgi:hypothetical protein